MPVCIALRGQGFQACRVVLRSVSALACRSASSGDVYTTRQGRKLSVRQRQAEVLERPGDMWRQVGWNARNQAVEVCRRLDVIGLFMGTRSSRLQRMAVCNFWERGHIRLCWEIVYNFWDRGDDCLCRMTEYFLDLSSNLSAEDDGALYKVCLGNDVRKNISSNNFKKIKIKKKMFSSTLNNKQKKT